MDQDDVPTMYGCPGICVGIAGSGTPMIGCVMGAGGSTAFLT